MREKISIDERLKKIKDLPFEEILKLAQDVREKTGLKTNTPEGWQVFSFVTNIGLILKLDIKLRKLESKIGKLISTIKALGVQNQGLEKTNIALQKAALMLGFIAIFFTVSQTIETLLEYCALQNLLVSAVFTLVATFISWRWIKKESK